MYSAPHSAKRGIFVIISRFCSYSPGAGLRRGATESQLYSQQLGKVSTWTVSRKRPESAPSLHPATRTARRARRRGVPGSKALTAAFQSIVHLYLLV